MDPAFVKKTRRSSSANTISQYPWRPTCLSFLNSRAPPSPPNTATLLSANVTVILDSVFFSYATFRDSFKGPSSAELMRVLLSELNVCSTLAMNGPIRPEEGPFESEYSVAHLVPRILKSAGLELGFKDFKSSMQVLRFLYSVDDFSLFPTSRAKVITLAFAASRSSTELSWDTTARRSTSCEADRRGVAGCAIVGVKTDMRSRIYRVGW
mmetsp:Transcript_5355/g.10217  ORF Transcript_5355/g.10217 Transcript_5355/m.10217 type:complete len:210 (-) Transcript_5355:248-877(-)